MSKVAKYLNEHILGEVMTDAGVRARFAIDASVLTISPEMVVYPRLTNDIRKVARFAWQLAEKGHVLPLTARGGGSDDTGAAIGKGAIIALSVHMNKIFEYDAKQRLVRVQPGVTAGALQDALALQGSTVPLVSDSPRHTTVGGAVAYSTYVAAGDVAESVHQLEVILANGDVLQTDRLNKRALNKKKGAQGLEGDIYRKLDALIDDNKQIIDEKLTDDNDTAGYSAISRVKRRDGSFDLTPLLIGSQGTLGVISEMILRTEYYSEHKTAAAITFSTSESARDALEAIMKLQPTTLEYFDSAFFEEALQQGKHYPFFDEAAAADAVQAVVVVMFDGFNSRMKTKWSKRLSKLVEKFGGKITLSDDEGARDIAAARDVVNFTYIPATHADAAPPLFDGAYVPFDRLEDFAKATVALAAKHHVTLPLHLRPLQGAVYTRPQLQFKKVSDKQKIFKLLDEYAKLVEAHNGSIISSTNEGRFKTPVAYRNIDDDVLQLYADIKQIFDPHQILNPGVKQPNELRQLVAQLRKTYDVASNVDYAANH